jgi:hypothetical protein
MNRVFVTVTKKEVGKRVMLNVLNIQISGYTKL